MTQGPVLVSIIIPVFNKLAFTRQCLDRIVRYASDKIAFEVIVVDNGSSDGTEHFFSEPREHGCRLVYHRNPANFGFARGNNIGASRSSAKYLLFLNNDTLVRPGWLDAMIQTAESDDQIGIVGIKQLFPYTNTIHHVGIVFTADRRPQHLYPHANASLSYVNKEREYQAVTGSCLLIPRELFVECGMFDEEYVNGYEDVDLCLAVRRQGRSVVCCTSSFIYHYGQITETRTADDDKNAARFMAKWGDRIRPDELSYFRQDRVEIDRARAAADRIVASRSTAPDVLYFADDLSTGSALTWATAELALALHRQGAPVSVRSGTLAASVGRSKRRVLEKLMVPEQPVGGIQVRWSHYWPQHLGLELSGRLNLELFVINYLFSQPGAQPWDYWLQCLAQNHYQKLPLSSFSRDVLLQIGVSANECHILRPGYSPEIRHVSAPSRRSSAFRLLTVTNSHDLERYGTKLLVDAYWRTFSSRDDVVLVVKDYGTASADTTLRDLLRDRAGRAKVEYIGEFTSKETLIELYKSCDAFVSAHRGEGYGMKLLDAMACGLPVITPLFGGPNDFCTPSNCFPVEFTLAPVTDCLDTRSLRMTNSPVWAEPDIASLASQLRRVVADPDTARQVGEQGRQQVIDQFTWDHAADGLLQFVKSLGDGVHESARAVAKPVSRPTEQSPYWLGRRISVIVPTYNRKASLLKCLRALERQTILPEEFEVVVVDDGSTDGTQELLEAEQFPFDLKYCRQANQGPGAARNEGIRRAEGEIVLFIGDDILADERLLEEHLCAHSRKPDPGAAVLGHIDWPPGMRRSAVMDFVCGESSLQFAYAFIPKLSALDYRFFYTSNISLKRRFLLEAASDGILFDPCFSYPAFEDSELALRLEKRGLEINYCSQALAYHDHWMDLDSFSRREYFAGRMAVVFYRKHPQIDDRLQVRWIGDWAEAVHSLAARPELDGRLRALDAETDTFFRSLAKTLQELIELQATLSSDLLGPKLTGDSLSKLLNSVLALIFDVERTRGKVEEWYIAVQDPATIERARRLLACFRKLEFFSANPGQLEQLRGTIGWLNHDVVGGLRARIADLEGRLTGRRNGWSRLHGLDRVLLNVARRTDLFLQQQLGRRHEGRWLGQYQAMRGRLKRFLRPASQYTPN